jgi:hypothetical protein
MVSTSTAHGMEEEGAAAVVVGTRGWNEMTGHPAHSAHCLPALVFPRVHRPFSTRMKTMRMRTECSDFLLIADLAHLPLTTREGIVEDRGGGGTKRRTSTTREEEGGEEVLIYLLTFTRMSSTHPLDTINQEVEDGAEWAAPAVLGFGDGEARKVREGRRRGCRAWVGQVIG